MSIAKDIIKQSLEMSAFCVDGYLADLTDADLLKRPTEGANHMAWQLGHLITAEHNLINMVCPDSMPALPDGFTDAYNKETSGSDEATDFRSKDEYIQLMKQQREGTLAALEKIDDADLGNESPESIREYSPSVGATFALQASHWLMHSGQWVVVRRMLGKEPLF